MTVSSPCRCQTALWLRCLAALALSALVGIVAGAAQAQTSDEEIIKDRAAKLDQLQKDAEAATEEVDAATAEADKLIEALNTIQAALDAQQDDHNDAARAVEEAAADQRHAEEQIEALEAEMAVAQQELHDALIESYVSFQAPAGDVNVLGGDPWRTAREEALAGFVTGSRIDHIDELRRLGSQLERWRIELEKATAVAEAREREAARSFAALEEARDREAEFTAVAEERVETRLYEVQALQALGSEYAADIQRAERRIAEALARKRAAEKARREAEERARQQALAESQTPANATFTLVRARGFTVNSVIASETEGLLAAMEAEGFKLGGGAYRSNADQIYLRKAHCGTSDYAVWQMPASRCRPPTARPGRSNHEKGLAIDFTYNGRIISSRSSAVFQALKRIAPQFGFKNLPSEPWHWDNV